MSTTYTPRHVVDDSYQTLFATFATGRTKDHAWRRWQLKQLWWMIADNEHLIIDALKADLNRHVNETLFTDLMGLKQDLLDHLEHLEEWTSPKPVAGFVPRRLMGGQLRKDPLGVSLIIGAWNFPILLLLQPLVPAIAAGCCVLLKPSEMATHSQDLLASLVPKYLDPSAIRLVTGGPEETSYLLSKRFNQIFFTGSSKVARIVAAAAARHLTPVVLELGGQGPGIVTKTADIDLAAKRITYAKFQNAGQICLSVNHVFAEPEIADELIVRMRYWNEQYLSKGTAQMSRIINDRNFARLDGLLSKTRGRVVQGGAAKNNPADRFFHPTIVDGLKPDLSDSLLSEELFGPILPVIRASVDEAIAAVNRLPEPLAIYIFSRDQRVVDKILDSTLSGGVTVNNVFLHAAIHGAPFGGVGDSGMGAYHGRHGIDCFTHTRTVASPPGWLDKLMGFTYAPYDEKYAKWFMVKNKLGFKRGERLEDQRKSGFGLGRLTSGVVVLGAAVAAWFASGKKAQIVGA